MTVLDAVSSSYLQTRRVPVSGAVLEHDDMPKTDRSSDFRSVPEMLGLYLPDPHAGVLHSVGLLVLTLAGDRISAITRFDTSSLHAFDLPRTLSAE